MEIINSFRSLRSLMIFFVLCSGESSCNQMECYYYQRIDCLDALQMDNATFIEEECGLRVSKCPTPNHYCVMIYGDRFANKPNEGESQYLRSRNINPELVLTVCYLTYPGDTMPPNRGLNTIPAEFKTEESVYVYCPESRCNHPGIIGNYTEADGVLSLYSTAISPSGSQNLYWLFVFVVAAPLAVFFKILLSHSKSRLCRCFDSPISRSGLGWNIRRGFSSNDGSQLERPLPSEKLSILAQGHGHIIYMFINAHGMKRVLKTSTCLTDHQFKNEQSIYKLLDIEHENILRYFGSGSQRINGVKYNYLVLEHHAVGNLYNHLAAGNCLSWEEVLRLSSGFISGLTYLHEDSCGSVPRYAIAHRDLKSENILLKPDLTPVISDFDISQSLGVENFKLNLISPVGTYRYTAPEVLDLAMNLNRNALLASDIYSASLVLWEIFSMWKHSISVVPVHTKPYQEHIEPGKTISRLVMRELVYIQKIRPRLEEFANCPAATDFIMTMKHCWEDDADARLTAPGLLVRLTGIIHQNEELTPKQKREENIQKDNNNYWERPSAEQIDLDITECCV